MLFLVSPDADLALQHECFNGDAEPDRPDPWDICPKCQAKMRQLGIKKGPLAKHYLQN